MKVTFHRQRATNSAEIGTQGRSVRTLLCRGNTCSKCRCNPATCLFLVYLLAGCLFWGSMTFRDYYNIYRSYHNEERAVVNLRLRDFSSSFSSFYKIRTPKTKEQTDPLSEKRNETITRRKLVMDIISVGSNSRLSLSEAQNITMGSHPSIRHFYTFTEDDDEEQECHTSLTLHTLVGISAMCRTMGEKPVYRKELIKFRSRFASKQHLLKHKNPIGWLCAQKRPAESLYRILDTYRQQQERKFGGTSVFPDYLLLIDDDTYVNIDAINFVLPTTYPYHESYAVAGCMVQEGVYVHNFTFPWGGFGTIFTKQLVQRFIHPLQCNRTTDVNPSKAIATVELALEDFEALACRRIAEDEIGEAFLFQNGMSVADLMFAYVTHWKYTQATPKTWQRLEPPGFCFHSDWIIGWFVNAYFLAQKVENAYLKDQSTDRFLGYQGSSHYAAHSLKRATGECKHDGNKHCKGDAHICHHMTPEKMIELYDQSNASGEMQHVQVEIID